MVYQPIVRLPDERVTACEALVRWQEHRWEPSVFVPIAEQLGLIHEITMLVARHTVAELGVLMGCCSDFSVSINLSAKDLMRDESLAAVRDICEPGLFSRRQLSFEVTESCFVEPASAERTVRKLRQQGHRAALDDFGTGYAGLSMLRDVGFDSVKIDRSFVAGIGRDKKHESILRHIILIASDLGLSVTAEGVETRKQCDWLKSMGVDRAQGFLFSRPISAAQLFPMVLTDLV